MPDADAVRVPVVLAGAAAWCWRILVILGAFIALFELLGRLMLLVVPFAAALLTAALLDPLASRLRQAGFGRGLATLVTVLVTLALLGTVGYYVVNRAIADYPQLADQATHVVKQTEDVLRRRPFNINSASIDNIGATITNALNKHKAQVASGVVDAGRRAAEVLTGVLLWLFLTVMFLLDGAGMWDWIVRLFPRAAEERVRGAGRRAWQTLSGYITGQFLVALFHALAIGITLVILRSPLVAPLALLVFIGSFIPIVGAVVAGGIAVLVTLVAGGTVKALVLLIVLVVENQVEGHVLQPFVVGRYVRLHPVAIAVSLTAGALLLGITGAIFSVPLVAAINAAVRFLAGRDDADGRAISPVGVPER